MVDNNKIEKYRIGSIESEFTFFLLMKIKYEKNDKFSINHADKLKDKYQHWDWNIRLDDGYFLDSKNYDVKGLKDQIKNGRITIEVQGSYGFDGWLYAKMVDYIAIQVFGGFNIYDRIKLLSFINKKMEIAKIKHGTGRYYKNHKKELVPDYCIYDREEEKKDLIIFAPISDLEEIKIDFLDIKTLEKIEKYKFNVFLDLNKIKYERKNKKIICI